MIDSIEKKVQQLKKTYDEKCIQLERATGTLQASMKRLEEEFNCKTLEEAEAKLEDLAKKRDELQTELIKELKALEIALCEDE